MYKYAVIGEVPKRQLLKAVLSIKIYPKEVLGSVHFIEPSQEAIKLLHHASLMENYIVSQSDGETETKFEVKM